MIKAIAFDLWETLITDTPELARRQERLRLGRMEAILRRQGLVHGPDQIHNAYRSLWQRCQELYWSIDLDVPCRRQIEHFLEVLEVEPAMLGEATLAELEKAYAGAALEILPGVVPGAAEMLRILAHRELRVGLVCNTGRTPGSVLREVLIHLGLASSIDVMVFSNEVGVCKPQTAIFDTVRLGLDVGAGEMVFVGDNLYADVHGAQRSGMRGVHFIPPARGTAVAPAVAHELTIVPDAVIYDLGELPGVVEDLQTTRLGIRQ
ncbi:MAG TPA: HAD family hydrolase [Thermoanaerobaculia bacterium]|nr:HAD family hydrolase [Thermoanaerobaculia bacterium]